MEHREKNFLLTNELPSLFDKTICYANTVRMRSKTMDVPRLHHHPFFFTTRTCVPILFIRLSLKLFDDEKGRKKKNGREEKERPSSFRYFSHPPEVLMHHFTSSFHDSKLDRLRPTAIPIFRGFFFSYFSSSHLISMFGYVVLQYRYSSCNSCSVV